MSAVTVLLLLFVAWFLWQSGMSFLAFLAVIVAVLLAIVPSDKKSGGAPSGEGGYPGYPAPVMVGGGGKFPETIKIKVKPHWQDTQEFEDWAEGIGSIIDMVGRSFGKLFRAMFPSKK
jgi:hypothetical protein